MSARDFYSKADYRPYPVALMPQTVKLHAYTSNVHCMRIWQCVQSYAVITLNENIGTHKITQPKHITWMLRTYVGHFEIYSDVMHII